MTTKTKAPAKKKAAAKKAAPKAAAKKTTPKAAAPKKATPRKASAASAKPAAKSSNGGTKPRVSHDEIAERAYRIFLAHRQPGSQEHDWFLAEQQLLQEKGL